MKLTIENESVDAGTLQVGGKLRHFALKVGQMAVAEFGNDESGALNLDLDTGEIISERAQRLVGVFETLQAARMILVVKTIGAKEQMELAQSLMQVGAFAFRAGHPRATNAANQRTRDQRRKRFSLGAGRNCFTWMLTDDGLRA